MLVCQAILVWYCQIELYLVIFYFIIIWIWQSLDTPLESPLYSLHQTVSLLRIAHLSFQWFQNHTIWKHSCLATLGDPILSCGNAERARNAATSLHRQLSKVQNYRRQLVPSLDHRDPKWDHQEYRRKSLRETLNRMFLKNRNSTENYMGTNIQLFYWTECSFHYCIFFTWGVLCFSLLWC